MPAHGVAMTDADLQELFSRDFWEQRYGAADRIWSGRPNPHLVDVAGALTPGRALDVGCGEGADVVWLAAQGWAATGVDVSQLALDRGAAAAAAAGLGERTHWQQVDVLSWSPEPEHDLVTVHFVQMGPPGLDDLYRRLAGGVRPGGTLLVVGHHRDDPAMPADNPHRHLMFDPEDVVAVLDPAGWDVVRAEAAERDGVDQDGRPVRRRDTVVVATRRALSPA